VDDVERESCLWRLRVGHEKATHASRGGAARTEGGKADSRAAGETGVRVRDWGVQRHRSGKGAGRETEGVMEEGGESRRRRKERGMGAAEWIFEREGHRNGAKRAAAEASP